MSPSSLPNSLTRIADEKRTRVSPWVTLVERWVSIGGRATEAYHSFDVDDYVVVLAETPSGSIPIVRQFRPALGLYLWEFPGGIVDKPESPQIACERELAEETGLTALHTVSLGSYWTDSGRLSNRTHSFFVRAEMPAEDFSGESDLEVRFISLAELEHLIASGEFSHMLHVATLYLARQRGFV